MTNNTASAKFQQTIRKVQVDYFAGRISRDEWTARLRDLHPAPCSCIVCK